MSEITTFEVIHYILVMGGFWYLLGGFGSTEEENEKIIEEWLQQGGYKYTPQLRNYHNIEILTRFRREFCIRVDGEEKIYTLIVDSARRFDFMEGKGWRDKI